MAQFSIQHASEIQDGPSYVVHANHLTDNFNAIISDFADRLSIATASPQTVVGAVTWSAGQTFSSSATFNGAIAVNSTFSMAGGSAHLLLASATAPGSITDAGLYVGNATPPGIRFDGTRWALTTDSSTYYPLTFDAGVNAQSGTTYTVVTGDRNKLVTFNNASVIAVTLPQAGSTGFTANWKAKFMNLGAGIVTITPTTSTIDGASSLTLYQNQGIEIFSDGTNYFTVRGRAAFSTMYDSGPQTITAAGSLPLAHGLGTQPKQYMAFLKCATTELNYSVNDEVAINPSITRDGSGATNCGVSIVPDATNMNIRFGSASNVFTLVNKSTGAVTDITAAKWNFIVRAWA